MHPRRRLLLLTTIGVLFIVAMAALSPAGAQEAANSTPNVTITTSATGSVTASPDVAVIDLAVITTSDSAVAATSTLADNVSSLWATFTRANVSEDAIRTTFFSITPVEDENGPVTYRAIHGLEIRVPVDDAGQIVDVAVDGGASQVYGVQFTLAGDTRADLRSEALETALSSARVDADLIANSIGVEVRSVDSVSTSGDGVSPSLIETTRLETRFDPGPVTVSASVTVTYTAG